MILDYLGRRQDISEIMGNKDDVAAMAAAVAASTAQPGTSSTPPAPYYDNHDDDTPNLNDDPPPEYSDYDPVTTYPPARSASIHFNHPTIDLEPFSQDGSGQTVYYMDPQLDSSPAFLEQHIKELAVEPPRPCVRIRGTHTETKGHKKEKRTSDIVDFDVQIDLTPLLYEDMRRGLAWQRLGAVSNFDKVKRGTVFATRAPGFGGSGEPESGTPDIATWCRRFCESKAPLRAFTLEKKLTGYDFALVGTKLDHLVRATNYRGRLDITFPSQQSRVEIWSTCAINRWRLTRWIELTFYFTFLWLFTWPYLHFSMRRYETVFVEWPMSRVEEDGSVRYASMSEEAWYRMWKRPVQRAVLGRQQRMLSGADLEEWRGRGAEDFARGLMAGMEVVQRTFGWGGDVRSGCDS